MKQEMLINVSQPEECRIAILEDGTLEELYIERTSQDNLVGNIYKGRVVNLEPSIQAAFVDFGVGRNGFLHVSDLEPQYFRQAGVDPAEAMDDDSGRRFSRPRRKPPIQDVLHRGDELLVQVIKEGIGAKGPTLSTYISIPGRYLVLMPSLGRVGVSRKIEDDDVRRRLRDVMIELQPPRGLGFIVRTAGADRTRRELSRDLAYLLRLWSVIVRRVSEPACPCDIYEESDIVIRTIRDVFTSEVDDIWIDQKEAYERARDFLRMVMPKSVDRLKLYDEAAPLFHKFGVEEEIARIHQRKVPLKNGGSIVIDSTEALVAIDVNSGTFRTDGSSEETAYQLNMQAAKEIARQLRLRDLGGVIVNDFIDMRHERHRRNVERGLRDAMRRDRARARILRTSPFGLIEMTRQRIRPSLKRSSYMDCPCCGGAGLVKTAESSALEAMRRIILASQRRGAKEIIVRATDEVCTYLQNRKRRDLTHIEESRGIHVIIETHEAPSPESLEVECRDGAGRPIMLD